MSMQSTTQLIPLDALQFPLYGKRLIEASAGTGKTYTIANLYLRLLMPTRGQQEFYKPLSVEQILVVTFTEAATAELKARIRKRIRQARQAILQNHSDDVFLALWLLQYDEVEKQQGVERLLYAEKQMDEAAIFTIHGFCQRMLSQNAFESRMLFQQEIETDETVPLSLAVKDVWRSQIYPMSNQLATLVRQIWSSPRALQKDLSNLQNQPGVRVAGGEYDIEQGVQIAEQTIQVVKQAWLNSASEIIQVLDESDVKGTFWFNTPKSMDKRESLLQTMLSWADSNAFTLPGVLKRFDEEDLATQLKKNGVPPQHGFFSLVRQLRQAFPTVEKLQPALMWRFWQQTQTRLAAWKERTQKLTFTDLLTSLDEALQRDGAEQLALRIRQLYPLAMIDEFQDTDPVQYRIFSTVYTRSAAASVDSLESQRQLGLIMIGDPKQAIYAFRGADIYTYLAAKQSVDASYSLATNYRSSAAMIQSINQLFATQDNPFKVTGIEFAKVQDCGVATRFVRSGQPQAALQFLLPESLDVVKPADYEVSLAALSAAHIHALLLEGQQGSACLGKDIVCPKDIAVLVAGYRQAQLIKQELSERGIASVYLSDRGSVFASTEARDLWLILNAIHEGAKETAMRTALATQLLDYSHQELDAFNQDDVHFEFWVERFLNYRLVWELEGILPMLRVFMEDLKLAAGLLSLPQGERKLTNVLHLGEKLQQKAMETDSKEGLLRYLLLSMQNPDGNSDEQKIRLESDADLVRIITIHKSKGLEYPIVYLPFALKPVNNRDQHALYHETRFEEAQLPAQLWLASFPNDDQLQAHEAELFATEVRLAYVALTRAKDACFIGCAEVGKVATKTQAAKSHIHLSGVGSLLYAGEPQPVGQLPQVLGKLLESAQAEPHTAPYQMALTTPDIAQTLARFQDQSLATEALQARVFNGHIERDWWVGSYSSLVVGDDAHNAAPMVPGVDEGDDIVAKIALEPNAVNAPQEDELIEELVPEANRFSFPRGANPGTFLHSVLEGTPLTQRLAAPNFSDLIAAKQQTLMLEYFERQGYQDWQGVLMQWLQDIVRTPLSAQLPEMSLGQLAPQQSLKEMEFYLPVAGFRALQLDAIARRYDEVSRHAPSIQDRPLKGLLKGYIDLLFEWQGKYYVVDYKSNHLGDQAADYQTDGLAVAIAEHRYDLQYQLYTLALHRYLSSRLPDYDYDKHIGGVYYLFLRGMDGQSQNGIYHTRLTKAQVLEMDALFQAEHFKDGNTERQYGLF